MTASSIPPTSSVEAVNHPDPTAAGYVVVGTGVYIGNGWGLTAGHVVYDVVVGGNITLGAPLSYSDLTVIPQNGPNNYLLAGNKSSRDYLNKIHAVCRDTVDYYNNWYVNYNDWLTKYRVWQATGQGIMPVLKQSGKPPYYSASPQGSFKDCVGNEIKNRSANPEDIYYLLDRPDGSRILSNPELTSIDSIMYKSSHTGAGTGEAFFYDKSDIANIKTYLFGADVSIQSADQSQYPIVTLTTRVGTVITAPNGRFEFSLDPTKQQTKLDHGDSGSPIVIDYNKGSYVLGAVSAVTTATVTQTVGACVVKKGVVDSTNQVVTDNSGVAHGVYFNWNSFNNLSEISSTGADLSSLSENIIVGVDVNGRGAAGNASIGTARRDLFIGKSGAETFYASAGDIVNPGSGNNTVIFNPSQYPNGNHEAMTVKFGITADGKTRTGNTVVETEVGSGYVLDLSSDSSINKNNVDLIAGGQTLYWFPGSPDVASKTKDWLKNAHVEFLAVRDPHSKNIITFVNQNTAVGITTPAHDGIFGAIGTSPITKIIFADKSSMSGKEIYEYIKKKALKTKGKNLALHNIKYQSYGIQVDKFSEYFSPNPLTPKKGLSTVQLSQPASVTTASSPIIGDLAAVALPEIAVTGHASSGEGFGNVTPFVSGPGILYGTVGADSLDTEGVYSVVYGEGGGDTFIFNQGYGSVSIEEADASATPNNVLQLGAGLTAANTTVSANDSGDIMLDFANGDRVTLAGELLSANGTAYGVQQVQFADGIVWTYAGLLAQLQMAPNPDRVLYGDASANVLDGEGILQTLEGFGGGDTFIFNKGYGELAIEEKVASGSTSNILKLGEGLTAANATVTADSSGMIIIDFGGGDQVWLVGQLNSGGGIAYGVQQIQFADGAIWTEADLVTRLDVVNANSATLYGDNNAQTFDTKGIDDTIIGGGGDDIITYKQGYGAVTLTETDLGASPNNVLQLGVGITAAGTAVTVSSSGDLVLDFGSGDTITLTNAIYSGGGTAYGVQTIDFADGTIWHYSNLLAAAEIASATNTTLYGDSGANVLDGKGIANTLVGNGGGDTFVFDAGYGALTLAEADMSATPDNVLNIGPGLSAASLTVTGNGNGDMILSFGGGDQITLSYGLASGGGTTYGVQHVHFVGGMTLSYSDLLTLAETPSATQTTLYGDNGANVLDGLGIATTSVGGGGGDTFVFIRGYGTLTIDEADTSIVANNVLEVGSGMSATNMTVTADASGNLALDFGGGDRVILSDALNSTGLTSFGVQQINFQGGTSLTYAQLLALADTPSSSNTTLYGDTSANTLNGQGVANTLIGHGGGDTFVFNQGYGALTIVENDPGGIEANILLGIGLTAANALVTANASGDLLLNFGSGDVVTIQGALDAGQGTFGSIGKVAFQDGTNWTYARMLALADTGSANNTVLYGDGQGDTFDSKGFASTINSTGGGDTILYNLGYGALTINEADTGGDAANTLMLGVGISEGDVTPSSDAGGDIILSMGGGDVITLTSAMLHDDTTTYGVQIIQFADGTFWNIADLRYQLNPTADAMAIADGDFAESIDIDALDGGGYIISSFDFTDSATNNFHKASVISVSASGAVPQDLTNAQLLTLLHAHVGTDTLGSDTGSIDWGFAGAGAFDYLLPGQSVTLDYVVAVSDGEGGELRQNVSVTVNGSQSGGHYITLFFHGLTIDYEINRGALEIADTAGGIGADNTLVFGAGITLSMLRIKANEGGNLIITVNDGHSDQITIDSALLGSSNSELGIQKFRFADSSTYSFEQLLAMADIGSAQNTGELGGDFNANIFDTGGYSHLISGRGGADTILYNQGYGSLYINEADAGSSRASTLVFGMGINPSDVTIQIGRDPGFQGPTAGSGRFDTLILNVAGSGTITLAGALADSSAGVQSVKFADDTVWTYQQMVASLGILHPSAYPFFGKGVLVGSTEADTLDPAGTARYAEGNGGGDTIIYNRGYGALNIIEIDQTTDTNRLAFGQGIDPSEVTVTMTGVGSFVLSLGGGDAVTFQGSGGAAITGSFQNTLESYDNAYTGVEAVTFVDGTVWDISHLVDLANVPSISHTTLYGDAASNTFDPAGIADTIYSAGTADHITYNQGYGSLTITEDTQALHPANTIDFGPGITASMLTVTSDGNNLYIALEGGDLITITGALNDSPDISDTFGIQNFTFADGSAMTYADMLALADRPSATNTTLYGDGNAQTFDSKGIATIIQGGGGADTFVYNRGYGALAINELGAAGSSLNFGVGISTTDITLGHHQGDITVTLGNGDVVTLSNQLPDQNGDAAGVDEFIFADGAVWDRDAIIAKLIADVPGGPVISSGSQATLTAPAINDTWSFHALPGGVISFADSDLGDLHSVAIGEVTATGDTAGLDLSVVNYSDGLAITFSEQQGGNPGTIDWTFHYLNQDQAQFAYLTPGDAVTLSYVLTITDTLGRTATETVSITITGPAAAPTIAPDTVAAGTVAELVGTTGSSSPDTASGTIRFTDPANSPNDTASILSVDASGATAALPANPAVLAMFSLGALSQPSGSAPGSVGWNFSAPDATFDYLALGDSLTLTYVVQVANDHGATVTQNVVVTVTGSNDAPVVSTGTPVGAITEQTSLTGSTTADTATGLVAFTDADAGDTHAVTVTGVVASLGTAGLPGDATLLGWLTMGSLSEQVGTTPGSSAWTFSAPDNAFDYLADGQKVHLVYTVRITDASGATLDQAVSIGVTGTNDAPVIVASTTATGSLIELAATTGSTVVDIVTGAIRFADADLSDTHSAVVTAASATGATAGLPANSSLLALLSLTGVTDPTPNTAGSIGWSFAAADRIFDYLAAGESVVLNYAVQITDAQGATVSQAIAITVTGSDDAPVTSVPTAQTVRTATATRIIGVGVVDIDENSTETVSLTTTLGTTTATAAGAATVTGAGTKALRVTGTLADVNATLASLTYTAATAGSDTIQIATSDGMLSNSRSIAVTVNSTANHAPVIDASTVATGSLSELSATTASIVADKATGVIRFTDLDVPDTHALTILSVTASGTTTGLPANATLLAYLTKGTLTEQAGQTPGSVPWTFSAPDKTFDYLAAGEVATLTYALKVADTHSGSATQTVVVTVTGTNDAPLVATGTLTGTITERAALLGSTTADTATGLLKFTDVDKSDTHVAQIGTIVASGVITGLADAATLRSWLSIGGVTEQVGTTPGSLAWTFSAPDSAFDYLAAGQKAILTYSVGVTDTAGATLNQNVVVTITGVNDAPVIDIATTATGALSELANTTASTTSDTATGVIRFADADQSDTHALTVSSVATSGTTTGLPASATLLTYLTKGVATEPAAGTPGSIPWTFAAPDKVFDYLAAGEVATLTYVVTLADTHAGSVTQTVVVTVTGTNDAPMVATGTLTGAITERAALVGSSTADTATGLVKFTDVDKSDTHSVAISGVATSGVTTGLADASTVLGWLAMSALTEQAGTTAGSTAWSFSAPDSAFDYLATGQKAILTYTVAITDVFGAVLNQNVTVTVTGVNDAPTASAHAGLTTDNWTPLTVTAATLLAGAIDPDLADVLKVSSVQGAVGGSVVLTGGNAVFTPTATAIGAASFTYTISDGHSGTSTATVSLTTTLHQISGTAGNDTLAGGAKTAQIDGLGGNDTLTAGSAGDFMTGGAGNDTLTGGAGADIFAYHAGFGNDTINGFAATGTKHDVLQFDSNIFSDWAHLLGATQQQGSDLLITLDPTDKITLKNVVLANFTSADATFV